MNILKKLISWKIPFSYLLPLVGFIFVLYISWFFLSQKRLNEEEYLHGLLQERFQSLISNLVVSKHPEIDEIVFHKVWTKKLDTPHKVQILFRYSLILEGDKGGNSEIEGDAILEKSSKQNNTWIVKNFQVTDNVLGFSEPLIIKSDHSAENQ